MRKYNIDPKVCKILNKLSLEIAACQSEEGEGEMRTPFGEEFIVMMSEVVRAKDKSVLYGFGRMLSSFK
jgi:hypothetical protein